MKAKSYAAVPQCRREMRECQLPAVVAPVMSKIGFNETTKQTYIVEAGKPVLRTIKGITANIEVPENKTGETLYYRWSCTPHWIYKAPLSTSSAVQKCWATSSYYLPDYVLQTDHIGRYTKDLFFMETIRNERVFEDFSVLVKQFNMSRDYYFFLERNAGSRSRWNIIRYPSF